MKKLLAILAVTSLTVTSGTLLVSCTKEVVRQDKLQYNIDVLKQVLFKITGEDVNIDVNLGDYLTESEVNEIIQSTLDSTLGLQYSFEATNLNLNNLGVKDKQSENKLYETVTDFNTKSYKKQSNSIAQKKLFKEYTTALSNNESFDFQNLMDGFALGVIDDNTNIIGFDGNPYIVNAGAKITFGEKKKLWATSVEGKEDPSGIPPIETFTKEYTGGGAQFYVETDKGEKEVSALTALSLRFQDYFVNQLESDIISNIMVMGHMTSKLFKYREDEAYLNPTNLFTSKLQDFNPSNNDWNSNVKMIWTVKYDKDDKDSVKTEDLFKNISDANEKLASGKSIKDVLFGEGGNSETILGVKPILDGTSYDSYFGLSGFQGIKFDTFGDDPTSGKSWADKVNKQQNGAHIISNNDLQPGFDTDNPNYNEIVVVLPIYFVELMAGNRVDRNSDSSDTSVYAIKDSEGKDVKEVNLRRAGSSTEDIWRKWEGFKNIKGSVDVRDTLAQDENRENLINELMYMACTNSNFVDAAKRDIYSKYLDKETIYYSGIWNMVSKYIDDSEDEDM
ncbi:hypothetical protein STIUS_v1c02410 [Spiroplasma sp. TIUS-1]|uniref:lipoprotein n=1 Tax=Spiroplasma sp. TIUS-1 TaxID=216963 RepID=UPI001397BEBA|nr:lipoprotein [Spiroplasma sp. TIUS-1]QHX35796.1 hypothetical protein STIUS_v1c02410 [Spiroplasma sp. TIUS-1]